MVSEARRLATATFASWDMDPDQADLALLLVSEVVTNAVLHASVTPSPAGRRFDLELDPLADTPPSGVNVGALTPAIRAGPRRALRPGVPAQGVHPAPAAGRGVGMGRGLRPGPPAAPAAYRPGYR